jgi:hypothetical protein
MLEVDHRWRIPRLDTLALLRRAERHAIDRWNHHPFQLFLTRWRRRAPRPTRLPDPHGLRKQDNARVLLSRPRRPPGAQGAPHDGATLDYDHLAALQRRRQWFGN